MINVAAQTLLHFHWRQTLSSALEILAKNCNLKVFIHLKMYLWGVKSRQKCTECTQAYVGKAECQSGPLQSNRG